MKARLYALLYKFCVALGLLESPLQPVPVLSDQQRRQLAQRQRR